MLRKTHLTGFAVALCAAAIGCEPNSMDVTTPSVPEVIITETANGLVTMVSPGAAATLGPTSQPETEQSSSSASVASTIAGGDFGGLDLTPSNGDVLSGTFTNVGTFSIAAGVTVFVAGGTALSVAANAVSIDGTLDATGAGFAGGPSPTAILNLAGPGIAGSGPGGGAGGGPGQCVHSQSGGGGGYGGAGGDGGTTFSPTGGPPVAPGGAAYGTANPPGIQKGSGGGSGGAHCAGGNGGGVGGPGGAGGGAVEISAGQISVSGSILAWGANGGPGVPGVTVSPPVSGGGGGSGGGILLDGALSLTGALSALGGDGSAVVVVVGSSGLATGGGGGGGGRVKLSGCTNENTAVVSVAGGSLGGGSIVNPEQDPPSVFGPGVFPTAGGAGTFVDATTGPCNIAPEFVSPPTPTDGTIFNVLTGDLLTFTVKAEDADAGQTVTLGVSGLPTGATFPIPAAANPVESDFNWTPTASDIAGSPHVVTFTATDDLGLGATPTSVTINVFQNPCEGVEGACGAAVIDDNETNDIPLEEEGQVVGGVQTDPNTFGGATGVIVQVTRLSAEECAELLELVWPVSDCFDFSSNVPPTDPLGVLYVICEVFATAGGEDTELMATLEDGVLRFLKDDDDPICDPPNGAGLLSNPVIRFAGRLFKRITAPFRPRALVASTVMRTAGHGGRGGGLGSPTVLAGVHVPTNMDTFLRPGFRNTNEGLNKWLILGAGGPNRRVLTGFPDLDHTAVTKAELVLTIDESQRRRGWGRHGRDVGAHPQTQEWVEGKGMVAKVRPRSARDRGTGQGATWACAIDDDIANHRADCARALRWRGDKAAADAPPTAVFPHTNGMTGEVRFDVTSDVLAGIRSWVVRREKGGGTARYFSKDHPAVAGNMDLAPKLCLTIFGHTGC